MGTERQFRMKESFVQLMNQQSYCVKDMRDVNNRVIGEIADRVVEGCSHEPAEPESFPAVD
ncbi:hypothetical protein PTKIN_Ptkin06aG0020200 [Pterospermum kingtungense]